MPSAELPADGSCASTIGMGESVEPRYVSLGQNSEIFIAQMSFQAATWILSTWFVMIL